MDIQSRPAEPRDEPFIYATWLTKLISGEAQCEWSLWFRARHTFEKMQSGSNLDAWTKEHDALLQWRASKLREQGVQPLIERGFSVNGRTATIKGKADLTYDLDRVLWIEECKTGKRRDSDHVQALIYVWLAELGGLPTAEARIIYRDDIVDVDRSRLPEIRKDALRLIKLTTESTPPLRVPSVLECRSCNISSLYCPDRAVSGDDIFTTDAF
jgi:hypothetical protein